MGQKYSLGVLTTFLRDWESSFHIFFPNYINYRVNFSRDFKTLESYENLWNQL